jgi:hypothetical protein
MIFIGCADEEKINQVSRYVGEHGIQKTVVISADDFPLVVPGANQVKYCDVIMYVTFYRLLQEITPDTLIVINECLRTQNRYDLSYNCIRNFLNLTGHQIIFQQLPQIDMAEDFMILFDFDTRSRWKRRGFDPFLIRGETRVQVSALPIGFERVDVPTSEKTKEKYKQDRERLFSELGSRDPHTLPRNLYMIGGHDKQAWIDVQQLPLFVNNEQLYVARNQRLGRSNIVTYADVVPGGRYTIVDLPHRFIDYADFVQRTGQAISRVLVADLPVDGWYFNRYQDWSMRIHDTYASLSE